jgi:hypothetical protein
VDKAEKEKVEGKLGDLAEVDLEGFDEYVSGR